MRPPSQLKIINSKLDILKEIKKDVQNLQEYMDHILETGKCWTEVTDDKRTFFELDQYLMVETSICIEKCLHIATENKELRRIVNEEGSSEMSTDSAGTFKESENYQNITEKLKDFEKQLSSVEATFQTNEEKYLTILKCMDQNSNKIKALEHKLQSQEEENEKLLQQKLTKDTSANLKFEEIVTELQAASEFMSQFNSQNENVALTLSENREIIKTLSEKINQNEELVRRVGPLLDMFKEMQNTLKEQEVYINKIKNYVEDSEVKTALKLKDIDVISQPIGDSVVDLKSSRDSLLRKVNDMEKSQSSISHSIEDLDNKASDLQSTHSNLKLSTDIDRKQNDVSTEELKTKVNHIDIKLDSITSQVQNMVQHITHLKCKNDPVFVSAYGFRPNEKFDVQRDEIVRCDTNVVCSARENFDVKTGIFTAPMDGLYLCCAFIDRFSDGGVLFNINMTHSNGNEDTVGGLFSAKHCRHGSTAVPVLMNKNDQLYLKSQDNYKGLDCSLQFVCILIN